VVGVAEAEGAVVACRVSKEGRATCRRTRAWEFEAFEGGSWLYNGADGHICLTSYGRV